MAPKKQEKRKRRSNAERFKHPDQSKLPEKKSLKYLLGRPAKYTRATFEEKAREYLEFKFGDEGDGIITLLDFCCFAGVNKDYIQEHNLENTEKAWTKNDFSVTIKTLKTYSEHCLEAWTMSGRVNPTMAIFSLKNNFKWVDKTDVDTKVEHSVKVIRPPEQLPPPK